MNVPAVRAPALLRSSRCRLIISTSLRTNRALSTPFRRNVLGVSLGSRLRRACESMKGKRRARGKERGMCPIPIPGRKELPRKAHNGIAGHHRRRDRREGRLRVWLRSPLMLPICSGDSSESLRRGHRRARHGSSRRGRRSRPRKGGGLLRCKCTRESRGRCSSSSWQAD